jgi:hypothetical protein
MRVNRHSNLGLLLRVGLTLATACLASACAFDPVAGVPNLLTNQDAQCDIGPSWNETPMWDAGEVRLVWRYHQENEWKNVCGTSDWGCIRCEWDHGERLCTVDLRIRPRFSQLCHMAVLGHELGHALGKMHDAEPQRQIVAASLIPADTAPMPAPDSAPVPAQGEGTTVVAAATLALEPLPDLAPPHLDAMLESVKPLEPLEAPVDRFEVPGALALRFDRAQYGPMR